MKRIAPAPFGISYKVNKLADRVGDATVKCMMESIKGMLLGPDFTWTKFLEELKKRVYDCDAVS